MSGSTALQDVKAALRRDPNDPQALRAVALHYLQTGQYQQAKSHYSQAINLRPGLLSDILVDYEQIISRQPLEVGPRLSLAGFALSLGDIDHAVMELEEALDVDAKNVEIYNLLGKIFIKQGHIDEVIDLLERSFALGLRDVSLTEILAAAYLEKGRNSEAIKFYEEVLAFKPNDKQTLRVLGELYTRAENYNEAARRLQAMFSDDPEVCREVIQRLEDILKKQEGNVFVREILADIYVRSMKPELAVNRFLEIIRLDRLKLETVLTKLRGILKSYPGHPQAILALAEGLRRQNNFSEAIELYHDLARTKPEFLGATMTGYEEILAFCPEQLLARTYLAEGYSNRGLLKEALEQYEIMLKLDPTSVEGIIKRCRDIIKNQPQFLPARLVLGRAYLVSHDAQRAAVEAEGLIAADRNYIAAYSLLGEAYFKLKLGRKAVGVLGQALAMDPYNVQAQESYRAARERELEGEIENLKASIASDPWKISLHLDLARLYLQQGQKEAATRELQAAVKDPARAPQVLNLLGALYRGEGRYELAATQFNRCLELSPSEPAEFIRLVRFNLGTTYEARGLVSKALQLYEELLQEDIDFADLRRRVKYLKATSLKSMQAKSLIMALVQPASREIVAFWGREGRVGKLERKDEMSLSFGQNHNAAGFDLYLKGMEEASFEEFQVAVQLDVKFVAALNNLAVCLVKAGKFWEAKARLEEALEVEPTSVVLHNNLGVVNLLLAQWPAAAAELEKAFAIDPDNSAVTLNLGDVYYSQKNISRAMELYQRPGNFDLLNEAAEERLRFKLPQVKSE